MGHRQDARDAERGENPYESERDEERIRFIRDAAVAISAAQGRYGENVWTDAVILWECKPDDC